VRKRDLIKKLKHIDRCCKTGRRDLAQLELRQWNRQPDCPSEARIVLAALLAREAKYTEATEVLSHVTMLGPIKVDPLETELLISILTACELTEAASRLARRLYDAHGDNPAVNEWLQIMCVTGETKLPQVAEVSVEHLASELIVEPDIIPSLVFSLKHQPISHDITLLQHAIARITRNFQSDSHRMLMICQAMADLASLLGDDDDARRWAYRGLKLEPYSASLALVLARITDDKAMGPPARAVLQRVSRRWPMYPDVRAALIRREKNDGKVDSARARLAAWIQNEPASRLARDLEKELAA